MDGATGVFLGVVGMAGVVDVISHGYDDETLHRVVPGWMIAAAFTAATVFAGQNARLIPGFIMAAAVTITLWYVMPDTWGHADTLIMAAAAMHHPFQFHRTAAFTLAYGLAWTAAWKTRTDEPVAFLPAIAAATYTTVLVL